MISLRAALRALALGIAACASLALAAPGRAHVVHADGVALDWFAQPLGMANLGRVARDAGGRGEYLWFDSSLDNPTGFAGPDLQRFAITADARRVYVLAQFSPAPPTSGPGAPQLQVAFDFDHFVGLGGSAFVNGADLSVAPQAAWEALLVTRFGSDSSPEVRSPSGDIETDGITAVLSADGVMEIAVPWKALGVPEPPAQFVRLSAAVFGSTAADSAIEFGDEWTSDASDAVTNYGDPGSFSTTADETVDQELGYWVDVWFNRQGEVRSPLVITEFEPGQGNQLAWFEVVNVTEESISLSTWKIGDAQVPDNGEGMGRFPGARLLAPFELALVANNNFSFRARYGFGADAEAASFDPGVPDLTAFPAWAAVPGFSLEMQGDEVMLLDGSSTLQDAIAYKNGSIAGVIPHPAIATGHSLQRTSPVYDTDNCPADFQNLDTPTPGTLPQLLEAPVAPVATTLALRGAWPQPAKGEVFFSLSHPGGRLEADIFDLNGRRVARLGDDAPASGYRSIRWDGRGLDGAVCPSGVYLVRWRCGDESATSRVVLAR